MKKKETKKNIQSILSMYFMAFSAVLLIVISVIFSLMQYQTLKSRTIENLQHTCLSIADTVDQQLYQLNLISLNAISSPVMRDSFSDYGSGSLTPYQKNLARQELASALTTAKGFDFSIRQLNVYRPFEGGYGIGAFNGDLPVSAPDAAWYEEAKKASGKMIVTSPHTDPFLSSAANIDPEQLYISVVREFYNNLHISLGFVEVKKYYSSVFGPALQPESIFHPAVYVFSRDGTLLFPSDSAAGASAYFEKHGSGNGDYKNPVTGKKEYVCFSESANLKLVVATAVEQREFLAPVYRSLLWILAAAMVMLLLSFLVSRPMARGISMPIRNVYHFLLRDSSDRFQSFEAPDTGIREIDKLRDSINENIRLQKSSTETLMILKEQEVQAQMLALQSQMNPHFLYNSLSTIGEMAREGLTEPVANMCREITSILRYISSNREMRTTLEEELEICDLYLDCLKERFGDDLTYSFDVDDALLDEKIPKLCIQLLVENAAKFTSTKTPPWHIQIDGKREEGNWTVTVSDNGPGFDKEVERTLHQQMEQILKDGILPSLKIEGMGILNIFIRLYLLDKESFVFRFGTLPEGGAYVTVGGPVNE